VRTSRRVSTTSITDRFERAFARSPAAASFSSSQVSSANPKGNIVKILTIRQPWLWAITHATKRVENRQWRTHYRGPVLLHAAVTCTSIEYEESVRWMLARKLVRPGDVPSLGELPRGFVVARASIIDCIRNADVPADKWAIPGCYGLVLDDVVLVKAARFVGSLRLRDAPASLVREVAA
jgi:hypothetical protein